MTRVRPNRSDNALAGMIANATIPVVTDTDSADTAGETPNACENAGSSACAEYIDTNVVNPAANSARVTARYPAVPRRYDAAPTSVPALISTDMLIK